MSTPGAHQHAANSPPDVMTVDQLAAYLQFAKSSLYKLAQEGKVPGQKVGKRWRFSEAGVDDWLRSSGGSTDQARSKERAGGR